MELNVAKCCPFLSFSLSLSLILSLSFYLRYRSRKLSMQHAENVPLRADLTTQKSYNLRGANLPGTYTNARRMTLMSEGINFCLRRKRDEGHAHCDNAHE